MTEETDEEPQSEAERSTAPQSEYSMTDVGIGAVIALVGVLITFGIPLALL